MIGKTSVREFLKNCAFWFVSFESRLSKNCKACTAGSLEVYIRNIFLCFKNKLQTRPFNILTKYSRELDLKLRALMWNDKISPEVADLYESSGLGPVPGVLVDQEEHNLLQSYGNLTEDGVDMFRQLKCQTSSPLPSLLPSPDLTRQFEEVWGAVTGLDDTVAPVEAGDEDHAEAVEVAVGGAAPLVLDLGCCRGETLSIILNINILIYQYSSGWAGQLWVFWSSRQDRQPRHHRRPSSLQIYLC